MSDLFFCEGFSLVHVIITMIIKASDLFWGIERNLHHFKMFTLARTTEGKDHYIYTVRNSATVTVPGTAECNKYT